MISMFKCVKRLNYCPLLIYLRAKILKICKSVHCWDTGKKQKGFNDYQTSRELWVLKKETLNENISLIIIIAVTKVNNWQTPDKYIKYVLLELTMSRDGMSVQKFWLSYSSATLMLTTFDNPGSRTTAKTSIDFFDGILHIASSNNT